MMELRKTDQRIVRSIYFALRKYLVELGYYPDTSIYPNPKDPVAIADFKNKLATIKNNKGFWIDIFSESSSRNKGEKIAPRIVVSLDRTFNGEIGAPPSQIIGQDELGIYRKGSLPGRAANLSIGIYLISHNSSQTFVLNGIKDNVIGERNYIYTYDDPEGDPFYIYRTGYYNLDDPTENITERAYLYTVPDVYLGDVAIIDDNISPIKEIDLKIENPEDTGFKIP